MKSSALQIVITFFLLWLSIYLNKTMEIIVAYFFILSIGVLHGANDIVLVQKLSKTRITQKNFSAILAYVISVIFVAVIFLFMPRLALLLFVVVSGYHFGEEHWVSRLHQAGWPTRTFYTAYGVFILALLFYLHHVEVSLVIESISDTSLPSSLFFYTCILAMSILIITGISFRKEFRKKVFVFKELLYLLVFYLVFRSTSLLWAFAIYFVIWHSLPSLMNQLYFLYGGITKQTILSYFRSSALYWLISIVTIGILFWFFRGQEYSFLSLLFPFIAALTFPHVIIMIFMDRPKL